MLPEAVPQPSWDPPLLAVAALSWGSRAFCSPAWPGAGPGQRLPLQPQPPSPGPRASASPTAALSLAGLLAGWLVASLPSRPLPSRPPDARILLYGPRAAPRGLQAGCSEVFIGTSVKMRAVGVLRAFRSRFIGAGPPDGPGGGVQGNLVSPRAPRSLRVWLGSASLACFDPHLASGVSGLRVDEVMG